MERSSLRAQVSAAIRDKVVTGVLPAGSRINETTIAATLGVSRTPVREALLALAREGYLAGETGRGFSVLPLSVAEAEDLYPIVWTLEAFALRTAGIPPKDRLDALDQLNQRFKKATAATERVSLDASWHQQLLGHGSNRRLLDVIAELKPAVHRFEFAFLSATGRHRQSVAEHEAIIASLRSKRLDRAIGQLEQNWKNGLDHFRQKAARRASGGQA